jgi:nucleoside-diphosphate-sugar epimerase
MKRKILITGGAGFIGTHIAERFKNDCSLTLYDNFRRDSLKYLPGLQDIPDVKIIKADILDLNALESAMKGVDTVIHLAAIAGVSSYYTDSVNTLKVNILGTLNVLETMLKTGTNQMLDFSTSEVYGIDAENVTEEHPHCIGPVSQKRWVYAVSKLASEHLSLRYAEQHGMKNICIRPFNVYGPGQTGEGALSNFFNNLNQNKPVKIQGDGNDTRAWCFVSDVVNAVQLAIDNPEAAGRVFNIGNPTQTVTVKKLAEMVIDAYGGGELEYVEAARAPIHKRSPDITLATSILGWRPEVDLTTGIRKTCDWFKWSRT